MANTQMSLEELELKNKYRAGEVFYCVKGKTLLIGYILWHYVVCHRIGC